MNTESTSLGVGRDSPNVTLRGTLGKNVSRVWRRLRPSPKRLREAEDALRYYAEGNTDASGKMAQRHLEKWL